MDFQLMHNDCHHKQKIAEGHAVLMVPLEDIYFSARTANCLKNSNILRLGDLIQLSEVQLLEIPHLGRKSIIEILEVLQNLDLRLGTNLEDLKIEELRSNYRLQELLGLEEPNSNTLDSPFNIDSKLTVKESIYTQESITSDEVLMIPLIDICFSVRTENCMRANNIEYLGDLIQLSEEQLLQFPNFGRKSLTEILEVLCSLGLSLNSKIEHLDFGKLQLNHSLQQLLALHKPEKTSIDFLSHDELVDRYASMGLFDKIERLNLSQRSKNCLDELNVYYIGDLVSLKRTDLLKIVNFGRKSLAEIEKSLIQRDLNLDMTLRDWPIDRVDEISNSLEEESAFKEQEPLLSAFSRTIRSIPNQREILIIESRLGINGDVRTLEDIAIELGLTRERVRQIQVKVTQKILRNEFWDDVLNIKLEALMNSRSFPLFLDELEVEDAWFEGFSGQLNLLKNIITAFSNIDHLQFLNVDERVILTQINGDQWKEARYDLLNLLQYTIDSNHTLDDVELFVEDKFEKIGAPELSSIMFESLSTDLNFSYVDGEMTLISVGNSLASHLKALLEEQPQPMHYKEIVALYEQKYGVPISERYVHASLGYNNFVLFGRGVFGIEKHLEISEIDQIEVIENVEELMSSGPEGRQWHAKSLVKIFKTSDFYDKLDMYTITVVLKKSPKFLYLGRFLWKLYSEQEEFSERLYIKKVAYDVLRSAGVPLRTEALIAEISKSRGVSEQLQLHPNELFSRVGTSTWGLLERDYVIPLEEQNSLRDEMYTVLKAKGSALHKSELTSQELSISLPDKLHSSHIMGLLIIDPRFKSWHGGLVGLAEWVSSGRKTFSHVIKETAQEVTGIITTDELLVRAREKLGYDFDRSRMSAHLNKYGLQFDRDTGVWKRI